MLDASISLSQHASDLLGNSDARRTPLAAEGFAHQRYDTALYEVERLSRDTKRPALRDLNTNPVAE